MIKFDLTAPSLTLPPASSAAAGSVHRLMVLIPGIETDCSAITHRVWELAHALGCDVLFVGLSRDASEEPALRRALVTLSALVHNGRISAEVNVEIGNNWLNVVKSNWREGDLIVCLADHRTGLMQKPLGQILESKMNATVYLLSGPGSPHRRSRGLVSTLLLWTGFIGTVIGFFFLQVSLGQALRGWAQTLLFSCTVLIEFWLIWIWNRLFS